LQQVREHPEKGRDIRKFVTYYLPTAVKILTTYADLSASGAGGGSCGFAAIVIGVRKIMANARIRERIRTLLIVFLLIITSPKILSDSLNQSWIKP